jgi:hypothetical protein
LIQVDFSIAGIFVKEGFDIAINFAVTALVFSFCQTRAVELVDFKERTKIGLRMIFLVSIALGLRNPLVAITAKMFGIGGRIGL